MQLQCRSGAQTRAAPPAGDRHGRGQRAQTVAKAVLGVDYANFACPGRRSASSDSRQPRLAAASTTSEAAALGRICACMTEAARELHSRDDTMRRRAPRLRALDAHAGIASSRTARRPTDFRDTSQGQPVCVCLAPAP